MSESRGEGNDASDIQYGRGNTHILNEETQQQSADATDTMDHEAPTEEELFGLYGTGRSNGATTAGGRTPPLHQMSRLLQYQASSTASGGMTGGSNLRSTAQWASGLRPSLQPVMMTPRSASGGRSFTGRSISNRSAMSNTSTTTIGTNLGSHTRPSPGLTRRGQQRDIENEKTNYSSTDEDEDQYRTLKDDTARGEYSFGQSSSTPQIVRGRKKSHHTSEKLGGNGDQPSHRDEADSTTTGAYSTGPSTTNTEEVSHHHHHHQGRQSTHPALIREVSSIHSAISRGDDSKFNTSNNHLSNSEETLVSQVGDHQQQRLTTQTATTTRLTTGARSSTATTTTLFSSPRGGGGEAVQEDFDSWESLKDRLKSSQGKYTRRFGRKEDEDDRNYFTKEHEDRQELENLYQENNTSTRRSGSGIIGTKSASERVAERFHQRRYGEESREGQSELRIHHRNEEEEVKLPAHGTGVHRGSVAEVSKSRSVSQSSAPEAEGKSKSRHFSKTIAGGSESTSSSLKSVLLVEKLLSQFVFDMEDAQSAHPSLFTS